MSIRKRLALFILLMTGFLVVMGGFLLVGGPVMVNAFRHSLDSMNSLDMIRELRSNIVRQRTSFNRYLLVDDAQELLSFNEASRLAESSIDKLKSQKPSSPPAWVTEVSDQFADTNRLAKHVTNLYKGGQKIQAYDEATANVFPRFQKLVDQVATLEKEKSEEAREMFEKIRALTSKVEFAVIMAFALAFVFGVVLFRSLYRSVMTPLEILRRGADEFGKGQWDHKIDLPTVNEFGTLARSFNTMAENVKQLQLQAIHLDRMSAVGQLAGGVAHEINNPLTAVLGQAQILMAKLPETDALQSSLKKIEQAALRCKRIVRGLLDFSRPGQAAFEEINLNETILATLDLCEADLKRARVVVEKVVDKNIPLVEANSSELQQVILNLINNAIQAMPRGGTIRLETRVNHEAMMIPDRRKGAPARSIPGPWVQVLVRDNGAGIAKEHLSRVFEPFFTTKEVGKGTGLGLAVSTGIMQKHSGDLRVDSAGLNRGATFTMTLPVKKSAGGRIGLSQRPGLAA